MKIRNGLMVIILVSLISTYAVNEVLVLGGRCEAAEAESGAETVTFQAEVICLGCTLKKGQGAKAQCSIYGHKNALRTADGKIWTILENDASKELLDSDKYEGKEVEIIGRKFVDAQVIEVESFKVAEE